MFGYNPHFLVLGHDVVLPLPRFALELAGFVLKSPGDLRDSVYADYIHYSVATHRDRRAPLYAALNIDQQAIRSVTRSDNWNLDSRVGALHQLDNAYYHNNPWDRGHLARRASAAWGASDREAKKASDDTFFYSNAALQHANFNRDEWLGLEDWVLQLDLDLDGRITSFSGPVWGDFARSVTPEGRDTALVPSAFFKIVCFINKTTLEPDVRAFLAYQDTQAIADRGGRRVHDYQTYQVCVGEIEQLTGLDFDDAIFERNPCLFHPSRHGRDHLHVHDFPERIDVRSPADIVSADTVRKPPPTVGVFIAAAMVNPKGRETQGEWVSVVNLSASMVNLQGWTLADEHRALALAGRLAPGAAKVFNPILPLRLSNRGDVITLMDGNGVRVHGVSYNGEQGKAQRQPVNFAFPQAVWRPVGELVGALALFVQQRCQH